MQVTVKQNDAIKILAFEGQLDVASSDFAREETLKLLEEKPTIISLAKCSYISSSGLRALLLIAKTAKAKKIKVIYAEAIPEVMDVLQMTGFSKLLRCVPTIEEAMKELNGE